MRRSLVALVLSTPLIAACQTPDRFSGGGPLAGSERVAARPVQPPRIETAPAARVESSPLAPPPGAEFGSPAPDAAPQSPGMEGATPGAEGAGGAPTTPQQTARVEPPRQAEPDNAAPTRSSVTGNWNVKEASGSCRITLSSSPKLDLYGANTAGCQSRELQKVTAWELRGEEVYLYEPGGAVAARLKARGRSMDGSIAKTGAPIGLTK